jgi:hypothetical protein
MNNIKATDTQASTALAWLLFFFNPFLSLCVSLTNYKSSAAKNIVWAGCVFYGLMFNIIPGQGTDAVRYAEELRQMHLTQISLDLLTSTFYKEGQTRFDIYQPTITLFVSRFTSDYHILFAVFGVAIGYFYSRTIWYFVERLPPNSTAINLLFIFAMAFILNPGSAINGVRMYTAFYVFAYASLMFLERPKPGFLLLAASSILIHFSFVYPFLLLLSVPIAERVPGIALGALTASFFLPSFENGAVADLLGFLPGFQQRVSSYLVDPDSKRTELGWLLSLTKQGNTLFILASAYILPAALRQMGNNVLARIATLAILTYTGVNLFWNVFSFGRFAMLSLLFFCGLWSAIPPGATVIRLPFQLIGSLALIFVLPFVLIGVRLFLGFVSIGILLGSPLTTGWFYDSDQSAYDFLLAQFRPW